MTGFIVKNLQCFVTKAPSKATTIPMNSEKNPSMQKLYVIFKGVVAVNEFPGPENYITALNNIMLIASLVTPSPKTKLNNLGYFSELMREIAATTSLEHSSEHIKSISKIDNSNCS